MKWYYNLCRSSKQHQRVLSFALWHLSCCNHWFYSPSFVQLVRACVVACNKNKTDSWCEIFLLVPMLNVTHGVKWVNKAINVWCDERQKDLPLQRPSYICFVINTFNVYLSIPLPVISPCCADSADEHNSWLVILLNHISLHHQVCLHTQSAVLRETRKAEKGIVY